MFVQPKIARRPISNLDSSLLAAGLAWWKDRSGIADLSDPAYLALAPHLQLAIDETRAGIPRFFYVGERSFAAELLGESFTSASHAGEWWEDGGYAEAVSDSYEEVAQTGDPVLEEIKATVQLPPRLYPVAEATIHYQRLCLRTRLASGMKTITVITKRMGETVLKKSY